MKRACFCILFVFLSLMLLSGCKPLETELYENAFDELDIGGRINECAGKIEKGASLEMQKKALAVIKEDLCSIEREDATLKKINEKFIQTVDLLLLAAEAKQANRTQEFAQYYYTAKHLYAKTNAEFNQYKHRLGDDDSD